MKVERKIVSVHFQGQEVPKVILDDGSELVGLTYLRAGNCEEHGSLLDLGVKIWQEPDQAPTPTPKERTQ